MEIGLVGKPNVGKSTLFNALTLLDAPMAPYPFTTIAPNRGVAAVRAPCPHVEKGTPCTPGNAACVHGTRLVPVRLIDVPGLVPGAHEGKGLGHRFLDELRAADGFLQVVDASGATSPEGEIVGPGRFDPAEEVEWLETELVEWMREILLRDFSKASKTVELEGGSVEEFLVSRLTGLAISPSAVAAALRAVPLDRARPSLWKSEDLWRLAEALLRSAKPRLVAGNKCDRATSEALATLAEKVARCRFVPTSAEAELTLRRAARAGLVRYEPGDSNFELADASKLSAAQKHALDEIGAILRRWGGTGVQTALERLVFDHLHRIVVFPVEDESTWTDSAGRVLPDALLGPAGMAAREMAYRVHSDLGENFIRAIDGLYTSRARGRPLALLRGGRADRRPQVDRGRFPSRASTRWAPLRGTRITKGRPPAREIKRAASVSRPIDGRATIEPPAPAPVSLAPSAAGRTASRSASSRGWETPSSRRRRWFSPMAFPAACRSSRAIAPIPARATSRRRPRRSGPSGASSRRPTARTVSAVLRGTPLEARRSRPTRGPGSVGPSTSSSHPNSFQSSSPASSRVVSPPATAEVSPGLPTPCAPRSTAKARSASSALDKPPSVGPIPVRSAAVKAAEEPSPAALGSPRR